MRSSSASGDRTTGKLALGISSASAPDDVVHVEFPAATGVEGVYSRLQVGAQRTNLLDVQQQLPSDLFLVGFGQCRDLVYGFFEDPDHASHHIIMRGSQRNEQ